MLGFKNKSNNSKKHLKNVTNQPSKKQKQFFIQNKPSFPENANPQVSKVILEKVWNLKNIQIALFVGFSLLIINVILLILTNANVQLALIIILISIVIYSIILYSLLNPQTQKTVEKDKIRNIERQTIKVVEKPIIKPVLKIVEKPKETIKILEHPVIRKVSTPITIPINENPMENYSYVASAKTKKIHHTSSIAGRMIKPENREFAHKITVLKKKGYVEGQIDPKK